MALKLEGISVVIPLGKIYAIYEGGEEAFWRDHHPSENECDGELIRMSFSNMIDAKGMIEDWKRRGLKPTGKLKGKTYWQDLCVVDLFEGPTLPCEWLEYDSEKCIANLKTGVSQMNQELVKEIVENLRISPLFQLSLGSKELFHSNFLAWCCETWRKEMGEVWSELLQKTPVKSINSDAGRDKAVRREYKNHDLEIDFEDKELLLIELKIKSVPTIEQLEKYAADAKGKTYIVLMSLTCPDFFNDRQEFNIELDKKCITWRWMDLKVVAQLMLKKLSAGDQYQRGLLDDYSSFVDGLSELMNHFDVDKSLDQPFFLSGDTDCNLRDARLHDLVYKYRFDQLRTKILSDLTKTIKDEIPLKIKSEMTNGSGLVTVSLEYGHIDIGIQLQGRQFRHFIATNSEDKKINLMEYIEKLEKEHLWFDFNDNNLESENLMRKEVCKYGDSFIYKYRLVNNGITSNSLLKLIVTYILRAYEMREQITDIIQGN